MAAAASFSYKIGGLIFLQNWWQQGFGNITGGCSDMVWILVLSQVWRKMIQTNAFQVAMYRAYDPWI